MFSETKSKESKVNEMEKLKTLFEVPKDNRSWDMSQTDELVKKRIDGVENIKDRGSSFKPMEFIYTRTWERIKEGKDFKTNLKECNPNYKLGEKWNINCQRCVPTYEMRRRGYDVTANPKPENVDETDLCYHPFDVWQNPDVIHCTGNGKKDIESKMKEWGDGARAQIVVSWKHTNSGHTFLAEQVDGKTIFIDPQTGSTDVSKYFKRVEKGSVQVCRIDNLDVTNKILDCSRRVSSC